MLYIFSIYLAGKRQPLTEIELVDFVNKRIVIIPDYNFEKESFTQQGGPSPKFDLNSVFVQNRTKLITTSKEMVRRLMYMLRLYQSNNFEKLVEYKDRINIDDFFVYKVEEILVNKRELNNLINNEWLTDTVNFFIIFFLNNFYWVRFWKPMVKP